LGGLAFFPKELDFGIQTVASSAGLKTITISNLAASSATFSEGILGTPESSTPFSEVSSTCPLADNPAQKILGAGASCTVTVGFSALSGSSNDGFVQAEWTVGPGEVLLTGYSQSANLSLSASEIDFGTQFQGGLALPRYLYLSNASSSAQSHSTVSAPANSPFSVADGCPGSVPAGTACRLRVDYLSASAPSADSLTLALDDGLNVLLTGQTMPPLAVSGNTVTSSLLVSPAAVTFGNAVAVTGVSSVAQTVSITNTAATATPLSIAVSGDFSDVTSCGSSLAAGASCAVVVTFMPSQPGVRQGLLTVASGAGTSPSTVELSGTGTGILPTNNGTLNVGETPVGQPVVLFYKITQAFDRLMLQATGPYLVTLVEDAGFGYGDPPSSAYVSSGSGTCHNCWVGVRFQPTANGKQAGTLSFSSDPNGLPYMLQLTGAGIATSGLILSPSVNDFGTIPVNSVSGMALLTLTNLTSSGAAVTLSGISASGDFTLAAPPGAIGNCAGSLPYTASCSAWVQFAPAATGSANGSLSIGTSAGVASASLTGTGTADPGIGISPLALTFAVGASGETQTVSLQNTGKEAVSVAKPSTTTTNFTVATGCGALASGASCSIQVSFAPGAAPVTDMLSIPITNSGSGGTQRTQTFGVALSGTYTSQGAGLALSPSSLTYGSVATSTVGSARQISITNLTTKQVAVAVAMPRGYELEEPVCATLEANASCVLSIVFAPLENGDLPGTIFVTTSASDGSGSSTNLIYADGFGVGTGLLTISGGLIVDGVFGFGSVGGGQTASQVFQLTNAGTEAITVRRVVSHAPFPSTTTCGGILQPAGYCSVTVEYSPGGTSSTSIGAPLSGADMGSVTVESDAQSSPNILDLEGQPSAGTGGASAAALASFSLSESALGFGTTTVGDISAPQNLLLTNTGTSALQISSASTTADFSVQNDCLVVLVGGTCTISVASTPQAGGTRLGSLEISSDAADALEYVTLLSTGQSSPLTFSPTSLEFGNVPVGKTLTLALQLTNTGASPIIFSAIAASSGFAVAGNCPNGGGSLSPQASCTEQVTFAPTSAGTATGTVGFTTSASTNPLQIPVNGTGIQPILTAKPSNLQFGSIAIGSSANLSLELVNQGTAPITGLTLSVAGDYVLTSPCAQTTIAAGTSCPVQMTFTPTATGNRAGMLQVVSSDPASPLNVPLNGTGISPPGFVLTVDGGSSATATVTSGNFATFALLVTPTGSFDGSVALTCAPMATAVYSSCSLLPPQVSLGTGAQGSQATINTEESNAGVGSLDPGAGNSRRTFLALLLPGIILMFRRGRDPRKWIGQGLAVGALLFILQLSGCGGGGSALQENYTPPGQYQFQVRASSTSGPPLTEMVTLTLSVQAR
jgi:hypothetical protein